MQKKTYIIGILLGSLLSTATARAVDEQLPNESNATVDRVLVTREKPMSLKQLSAIADISSARDQEGHSVSLTEENYRVASFSRTTISIVLPEGGSLDEVITLDLIPH